MKPPRDQHFLVDERSVARIADLLQVSGRRVLEIGPGKGVLTKALLDRGAIVCAVELDNKLADNLFYQFNREIETGLLSITRGDAVRVNLPHFELVIANLPYSISSPITFRLLDIGFESAVLMYQKEFADRMLAPAGSRECGRLSIMIQTYARARRCFNLHPGSFSPPPAVNSTVVWIEPREPLFEIKDSKIYDLIVRELFNRRRKTVRTTLKSLKADFGEEKISYLLDTLDEAILNSRPEELYLEDFATISNTLTT